MDELYATHQEGLNMKSTAHCKAQKQQQGQKWLQDRIESHV